jgi:hypothetical protein
LATSWNTFHRRWAQLRPPLRPTPAVAAAIAAAIAGHGDSALLLGVTPELADIAEATLALDWSEPMIAEVWPGDTDARRAVLGDWRSMPWRRRRFSAVIGDGSLNVLDYADYPALFGELGRVLLPGARLALRVYEAPTDGPPVEALRRETLAGRAGGFHAFKWRLAMALVAADGDASVALRDIHEAFERAFPNRQALGAATGWAAAEIGEIDAYAGSETRYSFPTRAELLAALPARFANPRFVAAGEYELAERCPILVADFRP